VVKEFFTSETVRLVLQFANLNTFTIKAPGAIEFSCDILDKLLSSLDKALEASISALILIKSISLAIFEYNVYWMSCNLQRLILIRFIKQQLTFK
jgi:hypothetical protein